MRIFIALLTLFAVCCGSALVYADPVLMYGRRIPAEEEAAVNSFLNPATAIFPVADDTRRGEILARISNISKLVILQRLQSLYLAAIRRSRPPAAGLLAFYNQWMLILVQEVEWNSSVTLGTARDANNALRIYISPGSSMLGARYPDSVTTRLTALEAVIELFEDPRSTTWTAAVPNFHLDWIAALQALLSGKNSTLPETNVAIRELALRGVALLREQHCELALMRSRTPGS